MGKFYSSLNFCILSKVYIKEQFAFLKEGEMRIVFIMGLKPRKPNFLTHPASHRDVHRKKTASCVIREQWQQHVFDRSFCSQDFCKWFDEPQALRKGMVLAVNSTYCFSFMRLLREAPLGLGFYTRSQASNLTMGYTACQTRFGTQEKAQSWDGEFTKAWGKDSSQWQESITMCISQTYRKIH